MDLTPIEGGMAMPAGSGAADMLVARCLAAAAQGDVVAYFDLGVAFSPGSQGAPCAPHRLLAVASQGAGPQCM